MQIPPTRVLTLTRGFGATDRASDPTGPNNEPNFHYGVDVVDGLPHETYGTPLVCPFHRAQLIRYFSDDRFSKDTDFCVLSGRGASGTRYELVFAHNSALFFRSEYKEGDIVALAGNDGDVSPPPTPAAPFNGSHAHIGLKANGVWVDPLKYFDIGNPYRGADDKPESDIPRLQWAVAELVKQLNSILVDNKK